MINGPSIVYKWVRWFNLDTIMAVLSVQFAMIQVSIRPLWLMVMGISVITSFFYICDRLIDAFWLKEPLQHRHLIYLEQPINAMMTLLIMFSSSIAFWMQLPSAIQIRLVILTGAFILHGLLLSQKWYLPVKHGAVASIFTGVMCSFEMGVMNYMAVLTLQTYTLFNLETHSQIEAAIQPTKSNPSPCFLRRMFYRILMLFVIGISWQINAYWALSFALGIGAHAMVMRYKINHWFEWGELCYACPFILIIIIDGIQHLMITKPVVI